MTARLLLCRTFALENGPASGPFSLFVECGQATLEIGCCCRSGHAAVSEAFVPAGEPETRAAPLRCKRLHPGNEPEIIGSRTHRLEIPIDRARTSERLRSEIPIVHAKPHARTEAANEFIMVSVFRPLGVDLDRLAGQ